MYDLITAPRPCILYALSNRYRVVSEDVAEYNAYVGHGLTLVLRRQVAVRIKAETVGQLSGI